MELLDFVKSHLGINGNDMDAQISTYIAAAKNKIDLPSMESTELYKIAVAIDVTDNWNLTGGEIKTSPAFNIVWQKLYNNTLKEVDTP